MTKPILIAIDWGISSFRAFLLGKDGQILERHTAEMGIMKVTDNDFPGFFNRLLDDWLSTHIEAPILMSGMIGSEQGWSLAPHIKLPASLKDLAAKLHPVKISNKRTGYIVPGLTTAGPTGVHDIIRGEETQIMGAFKEKIPAECVLCLPGTHSKWVTLTDGIVTDFNTSLTGEALDVLTNYSILGRLIEKKDTDSSKSFIQGLLRSRDAGGLLHHLFGVRSQGFYQKIDKHELKAYLAGILIGHEITGMKEIHSNLKSITIVGGKKISKVYEKAFDFFSIDSQLVDGEMAAVQGHLRIVQAARFI